jgi:hypothetical protein
MDAVTPARGRKKLKICTGKKDVAFGGTLADLDPGGSCSSTSMLALDVTIMTLDVIQS